MAVYTAIAAGGNWNSAATWGGAGFPVAGDTALITAATTGTVTVNVASACAVLNCTGSLGTLAFNATLTVTGGVTLGGTITANASGRLTCTGSQTLTSNGITFPGFLTLNAGTYTLAGNWINTKTITTGGAAVVNKTASETLTTNGGITTSGGNLSGTATLIFGGSGGTWNSTYGIANNINFNCTSVTVSNGSVNGSNQTITYTAGTITAVGTLSIAGSPITFNTNGMTWAGMVTAAGAATINLSSNLTLSGVLSMATTPLTIAGAYDITMGTLLHNIANNATVTLQSGQTYTATNELRMNGHTAYTIHYKASTPSSAFYLKYQGTAANQKVYNMTFTDADARSSSMGIFNWQGGTLTRCYGIYNVNPNHLGGLIS